MARDSGLSCAGESQDSADIPCVEDAECLDIVRFRVSEHIYVCHKSTILKYPNSKLAKFIRPANDKRKTGSDRIVIDRNGKLFGVILRLMRDSTDKCWEDLDGLEIDDLIKDLDFFGLGQLKKSVTKKEKFVDRQLELLDGGMTYTFNQKTIVIAPRSLMVLGDDWQRMKKQLRASGKFAICISDFGYRRPMISNLPEVFRFFLPVNSDGDKRNSLPRLTCDGKDETYGDLIYTAGPTKDNFMKFLIAVDMYLKSTSPEDLLALEKRLPGVELKRHSEASS